MEGETRNIGHKTHPLKCKLNLLAPHSQRKSFSLFDFIVTLIHIKQNLEEKEQFVSGIGTEQNSSRQKPKNPTTKI